MSDYLLPVFALLATFLSVRGETWNKNAKGAKKLTQWGRGVIALALVVACISLSNIYQQEQLKKYSYFMANGAFFDLVYEEYKQKKASGEANLVELCPQYIRLHNVWETKMSGSAAISISHLVEDCAIENYGDTLSRYAMLISSITSMCKQYEELSEKCSEIEKKHGDIIKF